MKIFVKQLHLLQGFKMETEHQQMANFRSEDGKIIAPGDINANVKIDHNQIKKLENDESLFETDYEDDDSRVLAFWFGDPKLDILTAGVNFINILFAPCATNFLPQKITKPNGYKRKTA